MFVRKLIKAAPHQIRAAAKIDHAAGESLVHGDVGFAAQRGSGGPSPHRRAVLVEASAVAADPGLIPQRLAESLPKSNTTVFDGVVGVHFQVAVAFELQIY